MLRLLIALLFVAAASRGGPVKDEKLMFHVTSSRSVEEGPTIGVTFANGVKDELVLSHYKMNDDAVIGCNYLGHLLRSPSSSSVAVTGCLNKPGDKMEVTMISKNNINKMFAVDFFGTAKIIQNPFEGEATSQAVPMNREFDGDASEGDEIFDPIEEANDIHIAHLASIPSKLKAVIKFGYEDTLAATLNGEDFNTWIAGVFTHTQAHFAHAASLGTTVEFEVQGSGVYNQGNSWTADDNIYDARDATNALNLDGVDTMSWWCNNGGGGVAGIAFVGALCTSSNTNLNERMSTSAGSGFVLAHELGHNFGMSHDFADKHGGHSGPCNGQGIMSYGSFDYNQWSTCSKSDWEEHYTGQNWGNGCLEDISDKVIVGPSDVGGTCPPPSYKYGEAGIDYCCCSTSCCWLRCTSNTPPQGCISGVPGARWAYSHNLGYYQAVISDGGATAAPPTAAPTEAPGSCTDTANGAADNWGDSCDEYAQSLHWCGNYNNAVFQSEVMCCACGGGVTGGGCTDTANGAADNWGDSCDEYAQNLGWCGNYNNAVFQSEVMCCACGGGSN